MKNISHHFFIVCIFHLFSVTTGISQIEIYDDFGARFETIDTLSIIAPDLLLFTDDTEDRSQIYFANDGLLVFDGQEADTFKISSSGHMRIEAGTREHPKDIYFNEHSFGTTYVGANYNSNICIGTNVVFTGLNLYDGFRLYNATSAGNEQFFDITNGSANFCNDFNMGSLGIWGSRVNINQSAQDRIAIGSFGTFYGDYCSLSDRRKKKGFQPIKNGIEKVMQLRPVQYDMKIDEKTTHQDVGFIAQEVLEIIPEAVQKHPETDTYTISYEDINTYAIAATQEQQKIIEAEGEKISQLSEEMSDLKTYLQTLLKEKNEQKDK